MAKHKPASRLRRRLTSTALAPLFALGVAGGAVAAEGTVVIDSRGVGYVPWDTTVIGGGPPRLETRGPVTLDFSVLDGLGGDGRPAPFQLRRPPSLLAEAPAKPIRLKPPPYGRMPPRRSTPSAELAHVPFPPPLPPRRMELAALPPATAVEQPAPSTPARPITAAPARPAGQVERVSAPTPAAKTYVPGQTIRLNVRPPPTDLPPPPAPAPAAPVLLPEGAGRAALDPPPTPIPQPPEPVNGAIAALAPPTPQPRDDGERAAAHAVAKSAPPPGASEDLRRKFPIIFDRDQPPEMAKSGWKSIAPEAARVEARPSAGLPELASLAPPPDDSPRPPAPASLDADLPAPAPSESVVEALATLEAVAAKPGDAVLPPPPPPARVSEIADRPEVAAALPEPETATPERPPRRALAVPRALARVTAPGETARSPIDLLAPQADAPRATQLSLDLERPKSPPRVASSPDRDALSAEIPFSSTSRDLPADAKRTLTPIVARAKGDPNVSIRLRAGAVDAKARRARDLAIARALAVQRYLVSQGVRSDSIRVEPVTSDAVRDAVAVRLVDPA